MAEGSTAEAPPDDPAHQRAYLLVFEGGHASVHFLAPDGGTLVGRGENVHLRLQDASAARSHARIVLGAAAVVEDLGSDAGTRVNGERIAAARELQPGDVLSIGAATLVFHRDAQSRTRQRVLPAPLLRERVIEEAERARRHGRPAVIVAVDPGGAGVDRDRFAETAAGKLRLLDSVAWDGRHLLLLLPELTAAVATVPIGRVLEALADFAPEARAGFAACPDDGVDPAMLVQAACSAADRAPMRRLLRAASPARLRVGTRQLIAAAPIMARVFQLVERLADADGPVLVEGESGAGKEVVAGALHEWSRRRAGPFVGLGCAALPEPLIERELFGGSVDGSAPRPSLLERASGGVLFLDEIGELPPSAQHRLEAALRERCLRRPGCPDAPLDVRVVAATSSNLEAEVAAARFHRELYQRLSAARVAVPPLRERPQDLPLLARLFLDEARARTGRGAVDISFAALDRLRHHRWPGNVRELRNAMEYAAATCQGASLELDALPVKLLAAPVGHAPVPTSFRDINDEIRELEMARMQAALTAANGIQARAAELINMPLREFAAKVRLYGLLQPRS